MRQQLSHDSPGSLFDAEYYREGFGGIPYERNAHWLEFFAGIARQMVRSLRPKDVLDAGCAWGFLVEAFWDLGVTAHGIDISEYAVARVRPDIREYCRVRSLDEPLDRRYDLITCIEVLEHMPAEKAALAIANMCRSADRIFFSSTPRDFKEPTHVNVRPVMAWIQLFGQHGFVPDVAYDAGFVAPHAFLLKPSAEPLSADVLTVFHDRIQCRVELVERLQEIFKAADDLKDLRAANERQHREAEQWREKAEALDDTLRRSTLAQGDLSARLGEAVREKEEFAARLGEAVTREEGLSACLAEKRKQFDVEIRQTAELREENERLTRQLAAIIGRQEEAELLSRHLDAEYASPAWQLIRRYRNFMNSARARRPFVRNVIEPAVVRALKIMGAGPSKTAAEPAVAPVSVLPVAIPRPSHSAPPPDYETWAAANEPLAADLEIQRRIAAEFSYRPRISIITPVHIIPLEVLRQAVGSVVGQTYDNWELCLSHAAPEGSEIGAYLATLPRTDSRIKVLRLASNDGISASSNAALELVTGDFIGLMDHDDTLAPFALFEIVKALNADPTLDFLYSDKDQLMGEGGGARRTAPLFKPKWSPETMLSANYLTHFNVMRLARVREAGGWRPETDGAQDWDLFLRIVSKTDKILHIPKVLYHWRRIATSVAARGLEAKPYAARAQYTALRDYCAEQKLAVEVVEPDPAGAIRLKWKIDSAERITIILLSPSLTGETLEKARALLAGTDGLSVEVVVPLPGEPPATDDPRIRAVRALGHALPDRVAAAVENAKGEILVFIDEGVTPACPQWLREVVGPLGIPGVGISGAKLLDPRTDAIRHAGLIIREDGSLEPIYAGQPEHYYSIFGGPGWMRNWTAMSGACLAIRRETWNAIGGLSGEIRCPRIDVELCLRVQLQAGLRVAYNPQARMHQTGAALLESWLSPNGAEAAARYFAACFPDGDPHFNPNLTCRGGVEQLGRAPKPPAVLDYANESRILISSFDFTREQVEKSVEATREPGKHDLESITWFLPEFANPFYGGVHTILRFAAHLHRHGARARFVILGRGHQAAVRRRIASAFSELGDAAVWVTTSDADIQRLPACDAAVATLWTTAYTLLKFSGARRKFYFLQDYEPLFYPAGSTSALVEATYRFGFTGLCNTISLKDSYVAHGGRAEHFDPCIDPGIFYNRADRDPRKPQMVFCYARPGHPRNCFELIMAALKIVKQRLGSDIRIVTAGAEWDPAAYGVDGVVQNLGLLGYRETGALYRASDVGLVSMMTRHPSYLPLELMACGAAVITNRNLSTGWLLRDGENCLLTETSPSAIAESIESVFRDPSLHGRIRAGGLRTAAQYDNWTAQAEKIRQFMLQES